VPPRCPKGASACNTLPRAITVVRAKAPFTARFAGLPTQAQTSTTGPIKNAYCGLAAYLYVVRAVVSLGSAKATLTQNVSYCPKVR